MKFINGEITAVERMPEAAFLSVVYVQESDEGVFENNIRLVVDEKTHVSIQSGEAFAKDVLQKGMIINAEISEAMTRSIPPQAVAFTIQIDAMIMNSGIIKEMNHSERKLDVKTGPDELSMTRFYLAEDAKIYVQCGKEINFSELSEGMEVETMHANFMTASIPPQTNAYVINVK